MPPSLIRLVFPFGERHEMNLEAVSVFHTMLAVIVAHRDTLGLSDAECLEGMGSSTALALPE